jgi:hypothetical protein
MPHWAFDGLTPDEVYLGKTDGVVEALAAGRALARGERLKTNQAVSCPSYPRSPPREVPEEEAA